MSSIIKVDQIQLADGSTPTAGDLGLNVSGNVLQVVTGTYGTQQILTTNSYVDTGVTATITPKSSSSKILAMATMQVLLQCNTTGQDVGLGFKILRGSTAIFETASDYSTYIYWQNTSYYNWRNTASLVGEDASHGSTTALTYKVQVGGYNVSSANTQAELHNAGNKSSIVLIEIAG